MDADASRVAGPDQARALRLGRRLRGVALGCSVGLAWGCSEPPPLVAAELAPSALAVGETRAVELRATRFDVEGFTKESTLDDLRRMPQRVLEDLWLLDLDVTPLTTNALEQLRELEPDEAEELSQPAQNMRRLLTLTPDNLVVEGTNLEELAGISAAVGIPTARVLANLLQIDVTDDIVPPDIVAAVIADEIIGSHPNAQLRRGPVDAEHPEGLYPIAPRSLPLTLADVVNNFEGLSERFGAVEDHPGIIVDARGVSVVEEDFKMRSKVNVNALPFKGVDLSVAEVASVSSVGSQIETLHDFSQPDWLELEGLVEDPRVERLTLRVQENPRFVAGGTSRSPLRQGDSSAWDLPRWEFESVLAEAGRRTAVDTDAHCTEYDLATGATAFTGCIDSTGWVSMETFNDLGSPPEPCYLWDVVLELGQVRLHDGGVAEGDADVEFTVRDVSVGVPPEELVAELRKNLQANPEALREFAELLIDNAAGDADFYYRRADDGTDWLHFVTPEDIQLDDDGMPVRPYAYERVGFFADEALTQPWIARQPMVVPQGGADEPTEAVGDPQVAVAPGDVMFVGDDGGSVYRVEVVGKPGRARLDLDVTRLR